MKTLFSCVFLLLVCEAFGQYGFGRRNPRVTQKSEKLGTQDINECSTLLARGSCGFYRTCVQSDVRSCPLRAEADSFCELTKKDKQLNGQGKKYLRNVRLCLLRNTDVTSCNADDVSPIFAPSDIKSDCVYQNVSLCSVLSNNKNARQLVNLLSSQGDNAFNREFRKRFRTLSQSCNRRARENLEKFLPQLDGPSSTTKPTSPSTANTDEGTKSTTPTTTTSKAPEVRSGNVKCQKLLKKGRCDFYRECIKTGETICDFRSEAEDFCNVISNGKKLNRQGKKYLKNVRICLMRNTVPFADVTSCKSDDVSSIFAPSDIKSDCVYQNVSLCSVLSNKKNARQLVNLLSSQGNNAFNREFVERLRSQSQGCNKKAQENVAEYIPQLDQATPSSRRPLQTTTTSKPTTTVVVRKVTEPIGCAGYKTNASCDFFPSCLTVPTSNCDVTSQVYDYCVESENNENEFDDEGKAYIEKVRRCQIGKLLDHEDENSCEIVDVAALKTLTKVPGCLWQSGQFCKIVSTEQNCIALFHIYGLGGQDSDINYQLFLTFNQLASNCGQAERESFTTFFSRKFIANIQNIQETTTTAPSTTTTTTTTTSTTTTPSTTSTTTTTTPYTTTTTTTTTTTRMMMMGRRGD